MSQERNKETVTTGVSNEQDVNTSISKKPKKPILMQLHKLVICLVVSGIMGAFLGWFLTSHKWHKVLESNIETNQKVLEKNSEISQHEKEETYKRNLNLQLKMIEDLKNYKRWLLDKNPGIISTSEIDGLIRDYIDAFKEEKEQEEIIPEFNFYNNKKFENRLKKHLSKLEELVEKFSYSYALNKEIEDEISSYKEEIESKVKDTKILKQFWNLQDTCSKNLKNINNGLDEE